MLLYTIRLLDERRGWTGSKSWIKVSLSCRYLGTHIRLELAYSVISSFNFVSSAQFVVTCDG